MQSWSQSRRKRSPSLQNISESNSGADAEDLGGDDDGGTASDNRRPGASGFVLREKSKEDHADAEKRRRDAITEGYSKLKTELRCVVDGLSDEKASRAAVLQKSIEYVNSLETMKQQQTKELEKLKKEYLGLQIMNAEYEKMAANILGQTDQGSQVLPDEVKFQVFLRIMDNLFQTFDGQIITSDFTELSGTAFRWLEECCKPPHIEYITAAVLTDLKSSYASSRK